MSTEDKPINNTLSRIAHACVARASAQEWKGKARDRNVIEFFIGAASALQSINHPDAQCVLNVTALLVCTRGYSEVTELCKRTPAAPEIKAT